LVRDKELEITRLKAQLESLQALNSDAADDMSVMIPAADAVSTPIVDVELALEPLAEETKAPVAETSAADAEQIASLLARIESLEHELTDAKLEAETAKAQTGVRDEMEELANRLRQKAQDFDRLNRQMEAEKRKVSELERERELQNKSLQVLHQQLEMERNRTVVPVDAG